MNSERSDLVKVGMYISNLRKRKGYTQKVLGEIIDVNDKTISKWEQGSVAPDITVLKMLAKALDTTVDDILSAGEEDRTDDNIMSDSRKGIIKLLLSVLLGIIIGAILIVYVQKGNSILYRDISVREEFSITGFVIERNDKLNIMINKIVFNNNQIDISDKVEITDVEIKIKNGDDILFSKKYLTNQFMPLGLFFSTVNIFLEEESLSWKDNYYFSISFHNNNRDPYEYFYLI